MALSLENWIKTGKLTPSQPLAPIGVPAFNKLTAMTDSSIVNGSTGLPSLHSRLSEEGMRKRQVPKQVVDIPRQANHFFGGER